jgi:hypothetical protein
MPRLALAAACALALVLVSAGSAWAAPAQLRGAQSHALWSGSSYQDMERELNLLSEARATAVRIDLSWSSLETEGKGEYSDWYVKKFDRFLAEARERGIAVVANLWSTPCWASTAPESAKQGCEGAWWDRGVYRWAPRDPRDYADAAEWVVRRWGDGLAALEVWNEPNLPDQYSLRAADPAATYAQILRTAYPRIKEAAPGLTVLGGVLAFSDGEFLERLYDLGIGGHFDGISIHPYNEWRDPDDAWKREWRKYTFLTGVPWIHDIMKRHGDGDKGLWLTEFGFSTCGDGDRWCVSRSQQAEYTKDSFRIAADWPYVKAAIAYNLRNKGNVPDDREDQFGLVERDFTPKPAWDAFKEAMTYAGGGGEQPAEPPSPGPAEPSRPAPKRRVKVRKLRNRSPLTPRGYVRLRVSCHGAADGPCAGTLKLDIPAVAQLAAAGGGSAGTLGTRSFNVAPARGKTVMVRLSPRVRRALRRLGRVTVRATATVPSSRTSSVRFRLRLGR